MTARRSPAEIIREDKKWKDAAGFIEYDALRLHALYDDRGRATVISHLKNLGMGDSANREPVQVGTVPRLIEMLSVIYERPALRVLARDEEPIEDGTAEARAFRKLSGRMPLNLSWAQIDRLRNLFRMVAVVFAESAEHNAVVARVVEPYSIHRWCSPAAPDMLEADEALALCMFYAADENDRLYQTWQRQDDKSWRCWIQKHNGDLVDAQPYGVEGRPPFDVLPVMLVADQLLMGRAWLPIPQARLSLGLNIPAIANDVQLLIKYEGHSMTIATGPDVAGIPDETGPDKLIRAPESTKYFKLVGDPKIEDSSRTIERYLAMLALSESLPINAFSPEATPLTGAQLMVAERDLRRRRGRQVELARVLEAQAYAKYSAVAKAFPQLKMQDVDAELDLLTVFSMPSQFRDITEQQDVNFRELSLGTMSMDQHFADMKGVSDADTRILRKVLERKRIEWPTPSNAEELVAERVATTSASTSVSATPGQNPAALIRGAKPAVGRGGAGKVPGAFNAQRGTASEGASVIDSIRGNASPTPAAGAQ